MELIMEDELDSAEESFRQGWKEMLAGDTHPIDELWDGIDVERAELVDNILDYCEDGYGVKMSAEEFLREIRTW